MEIQWVSRNRVLCGKRVFGQKHVVKHILLVFLQDLGAAMIVKLA